jgi:Flp pilus assembly protein TadG
MTIRSKANRTEDGVILVFIAGVLVVLLLLAGLAIDLGQAYVVKAQLTKAVDGAALASARMGSSAEISEKEEAIRIFRANFPQGYMGTSSVTEPAANPDFFSSFYDQESGVHFITVRAQATIPTTFMRLAGFDKLTVRSMGEARRRLVDLSMVLDTSYSIGSDWNLVRDAARSFIDSFDPSTDRLSVTLFSNGAHVSYPMSSAHGFDQTAALDAVPKNLPGGYTAMVEGLYRGWDELRSVPAGSQSGLRVIVLFTDGCTNLVPGNYTYKGTEIGHATGLATTDFPAYSHGSPFMSSDSPTLGGLYLTDCDRGAPNCGKERGTNINKKVRPWDSTYVHPDLPWLPSTSSHDIHRSLGIPTAFPLQTSMITVDGIPQSSTRGLRNISPEGKYPADVWNINNSARNLVEIIANAARSEYPANGDYPIRIYTIGMGDLIRYYLGTRMEQSEAMLKRIANDRTSPDYNSDQVAGKYYYAQTADDLDPVFKALRSEIVRLSR